MRRSSATAVPVQDRPHEPEVREAIAEIVRDFYPTEVSNFTVDRIAPDRAIVTAEIPSRIGEKVTREVYFDRSGV